MQDGRVLLALAETAEMITTPGIGRPRESLSNLGPTGDAALPPSPVGLSTPPAGDP